MGNSKITKIILIGLLIHALVLKAAFDIYFSSPIDHGMTPILSTAHPPAKRLVLFVADGLRAESIMAKGHKSRIPNLMKIRIRSGVAGTSFTRVPTESRPGHVAILAGIYEDPSAILSGWTKNPVEFDSVINQSRNAWCWGSPDILTILNKDNLPHIHIDSYDAYDEDFGKKNTSSLDIWVFKKVQKFLYNQIQCKDCHNVEASGNIFFLHLLGMDTVGHAYKPDSKEYLENLKIVDEHIPKMESLFEKAFPDSSTAYIFTADHGMSNWGSHGAGSAHETETPIIAWGAGVKAAMVKRDINQVDIAPLISALIGINFPANSLGKLPYQYLNTSRDVIAHMLIANVKQLYEIFNIKRERRKENAIRFVPYPKVENREIEGRINNLERFIEVDKYDALRKECEALMDILKAATHYYHNYYQLPILMAVTVGLVGWIVYLATLNVPVVNARRNVKFLVRSQVFGFSSAYSFTFVTLYVQKLPLVYYAYFFFPIIMAQVLVRRYLHLLAIIRGINRLGFSRAFGYILLTLFGVRLLVLGFQERRCYTLLMNLMALCVYFSNQLRRISKPKKLLWMLTCISVSLFPMMPVMKTTFTLPTYIVGHFLWWCVIDTFLDHYLSHPGHVCSHTWTLKIQLESIKFAPVIMYMVEYDFIAADSNWKYLAWMWSICPIICIPNSCVNVFIRLVSIMAGFVPFYLLVSTNYEGIFLALYSLLLQVWIRVECDYRPIEELLNMRFVDWEVQHKITGLEDFRRAFFFVILIFIGFFGTGNIASLNSFDPMWVRCFLTVFSPFKMAGLILLKISVPFILASCAFQAVNLLRRGNVHKMFCYILMISDVMVLELLYSITNIGSWLEIGMSLSNFIIMQAFVLIILILYGTANILTSTRYNIFYIKNAIPNCFSSPF